MTEPAHPHTPPEPPLTRDTVRQLDTAATAEYGIPSLLLMENAGRGAAEFARQLLMEAEPADEAQRAARTAVQRRLHETLAGVGVCMLAGRGNNGGDGFVVARHLHNFGADVMILLVGAERRNYAADSDAGLNLGICEKLGMVVREVETAEQMRDLDGLVHNADLIVDALFGTGLSRPVEEPHATAIQVINEGGQINKIVLALDIPSGLDANTGAVLGTAVTSHATATFGTLKTGLLAGEGPTRTGEIAQIEISLPRELIIDAYTAAEKH